MNRYGTIIKCNGGYRVAPFYGEHLNSSSGDFTALMISRLDIDVKFVDLPPVQNHEIAELLRYKIRSIYPGKPEKTVFDYILFGKKNKRYAALYITQRDVIEAHRDLSEGKPLFHSLSLLTPYIEQYLENDIAFIMFHEDCVEITIYEAGIFQSSCVIKRMNSIDGDLRKLFASIAKTETGSEIIFFCADHEIHALQQALSKSFGKKNSTITLTPFEVLSQSRVKKVDYIFSVKKDKHYLSQKILIPLLVFLCLLLTGAVLHRRIQSKKSYFSELSTQLQQLERKSAQFNTLEKDIDGFESELQDIKEKIPCNIYLLLTELSFILGTDTKVTHFLVDKNMFQIEGVSPSPLQIMDRFAEREKFHKVKLSQIIPLDNSEDKRFKVNGFVNTQ